MPCKSPTFVGFMFCASVVKQNCIIIKISRFRYTCCIKCKWQMMISLPNSSSQTILITKTYCVRVFTYPFDGLKKYSCRSYNIEIHDHNSRVEARIEFICNSCNRFWEISYNMSTYITNRQNISIQIHHAL